MNNEHNSDHRRRFSENEMRNNILTLGVMAAFVVLVVAGVAFLSSTRSDQNKTAQEQEESGILGGPLNGDNEGSYKGTVTDSKQTVEALIGNFFFTPNEIRIKKGDTVVWTNINTLPHTVTSDNAGGSLDSPSIPPGQNYSYTFNETGEFSYHCTPHPQMKGKVIVE